MGYYTTFTGEIRIEPPLTWNEFRDDGFLGKDYDVRLHVAEDMVDTAAGPLLRRTADAIIPVQEDEYKGYSIVEHVQELVDRYGDGHTFTGRLDAEGEAAGDLWRLVVRNGRAIRVEPRIIWPDDEDGAL